MTFPWTAARATSMRKTIKTVEAQVTGDFGTVMELGGRDPQAEGTHQRRYSRTMRMQAVKFGAEGIGLCRTEHMFFAEDRIAAMREMIVSKTVEQRKRLWPSCCPCREKTSRASIRRWRASPVTIRFLDPPLHEFLPTDPRGYQGSGK